MFLLYMIIFMLFVVVCVIVGCLVAFFVVDNRYRASLTRSVVGCMLIVCMYVFGL